MSESANRTLRVLYIEANEDGSVGGSHQVLYDMLNAFDRSRYEPIVLFYQDNRFTESFREAGVRVITWDAVRAKEREVHETRGKVAKTFEIFRAIARRRAFLREEGIDLIHLNNSPRTGHDDWLPAARTVGIPIVASARGDADPLPGSGLRHAVHCWLMTRVDRVLAVSEYIADAWRKQGVPPERVFVVHDGVNPATIRSLGQRTREEIRASIGVPAGRLLVAMVGNIREWKGQHVVIAALREMDPAERARLYVAFVGAVRTEDEEYLEGLRKSVAEGELTDVVAFIGSRTDVPEIFSASDIAVHSSVTPEPGGTVVIEAMSFGAPVICADRGGHFDYLEPGLGLTHDVNNPRELAQHLTSLARDPELRERMVAQSRVRAAQFSVERTARKTEAVYEDLLRERASDASPRG